MAETQADLYQMTVRIVHSQVVRDLRVLSLGRFVNYVGYVVVGILNSAI